MPSIDRLYHKDKFVYKEGKFQTGVLNLFYRHAIKIMNILYGHLKHQSFYDLFIPPLDPLHGPLGSS